MKWNQPSKDQGKVITLSKSATVACTLCLKWMAWLSLPTRMSKMKLSGCLGSLPSGTALILRITLRGLFQMQEIEMNKNRSENGSHLLNLYQGPLLNKGCSPWQISENPRSGSLRVESRQCPNLLIWRQEVARSSNEIFVWSTKLEYSAPSLKMFGAYPQRKKLFSAKDVARVIMSIISTSAVYGSKRASSGIRSPLQQATWAFTWKACRQKSPNHLVRISKLGLKIRLSLMCLAEKVLFQK